MPKLALCLVLATLAVAAPAQTSPVPSLASAKQAVVLRHLSTQVAFQPDGTGFRNVQASFQVEDAAGVKALAVVAFPYTASNESVTVDYVRVRQPDGTVVATPPENIRDLPADISREAPMYSDLMEKQIVVKGLDVGDTLEYSVRFSIVKPLIPGQFWFAHAFTRNLISQDEELEISLPADSAAQVASTQVQPSVSEAAGRRIYRWKTSNPAPGVRPDPTAPLPPPSVLVTTFKDWAQVGAWYHGLQAPQINLTPAIRAKADELTRGLTGDDARIQALYAFVAQRIHYVSISFGIGRYQPHPADDVLSNGYGDCKDKHTLLAALLRAAGFTAWPALVAVGQTIDDRVPSPGQFNHVVTVVEHNGRLEWLDATAEVAPAGWLAPELRGQSALLVSGSAPAALIPLPTKSPVPSQETFDLNGALSAEGTLQAHVNYTFSGDSAVLMRSVFRATVAAQWQQVVQALVGFVGFAGKVSDVTVSGLGDIQQPLVLAYTYHRENYGDWSNHQIQPPLPAMLLPRWNDAGATVLGPDAHQIVARSVITLPPGYSLTPTSSTSQGSDFANYHSSYGFSNGQFTAQRTLDILRKTVPADQHSRYLEFTKAVSADVDVWTTFSLSPGTAATMTPGQQSVALTDTGWQQYQNREFIGAESSLRTAVKLDPRNSAAWNDLGLTEMAQRHLAGAETDFKSAIAADPSDPFAYNNLGRVLEQQGKLDQAEAAFHQQIGVSPRDRFAHANLGHLLLQEKRFPAAVLELQLASGIANSASIQYDLGEAELGAGGDSGVAALEAAAQMQPTPLMQNNVAFSLADSGHDLALAATLAESAVSTLERELSGVQLDSLTPVQLFDTSLLGNAWDTLGWIRFRQGKLASAENYVAAAWSLTQNAAEGDHLAQIYEAQKRMDLATTTYAEVVALHGPDHATNRLRSLAGGDAEANAMRDHYAGETSDQRTLQLPRPVQGTVNATLLLSFAPGAHLLEVRSRSSDPLPRNLAHAWASVKFPVEFPTGSQTRLVRLGLLSCVAGSANCVLVLLPAGAVTLRP